LPHQLTDEKERAQGSANMAKQVGGVVLACVGGGVYMWFLIALMRF